MNKIIGINRISNDICFIELEAPIVARNTRPGNFVIIRINEKSERVPLPIYDVDHAKGCVTLISTSTNKDFSSIIAMKEGDTIADALGPLGTPVSLEKNCNILCIGDESGIAALMPTIKALKEADNKVLTCIYAHSEKSLILAEEAKQVSNETLIITEDGSLGIKASIEDSIEYFSKKEKIDKIYIIASPKLMQACCEEAKNKNIPTTISLYSTMLDGTGICGACRLTINGKMKFSCIDGPSFDGSLVDWEEVIRRTDRTKLVKDTHPIKEDVTDSSLISVETSEHEFNSETLEELTNRDSEWRKELRAAIKPKERMALERTPMPTLDPDYRITTRINEVTTGFTKEMAMMEAKRCLDCAKPTCVIGCPAGNNIPSFIKNIERGEFLAAAEVLRSTTSLPAVCGRVCPQEEQCEGSCIHLKMNRPAVAIGSLERFVADYERENNLYKNPEKAPSNGIKVAAIGSGPAGLSFAADMAKNGFEVHIFEALHELGGVLKYGIPEFRLPSRVVEFEIDKLRALDVKFHTDCIVGKTITIDELRKEGFKAFFIGTGAGTPNFMNIPGENLLNIYSANEYLMRVNLMDADRPDTETPIKLGRRVVVVGGGNTAMDSCATARRLGAEVTLVYRRSEEEMPACFEERKLIKEEGVKFMTLHNPKEYLSDQDGRVRAVVLDIMELGEPDESGRRSPKTTGKTITIECDQVIVAVGVSPNPLLPKSIEGLELGKKNWIIVDEEQRSSKSDIYAGGDIARGGATVILAMGDGRRAAANMTQDLLQN
ncbi:NADPH-dependent glutamate synthase [Prevotella sp. HUN102]|uniref:NADPH-dependent glutamate synthase n=1 Tax=Prevotella sp. HUN102 TaxID=1392486 RepID=UPI00048CAC81|nr:NADPH-dependent glutamate synthase [Prevotella sp. HUN102]